MMQCRRSQQRIDRCHGSVWKKLGRHALARREFDLNDSRIVPAISPVEHEGEAILMQRTMAGRLK